LQQLENNRRNNRLENTALKNYNLSCLNRLKVNREKRNTVSPMSLSEKENIKDMIWNTKNTTFLPNAKNLLEKSNNYQS